MNNITFGSAQGDLLFKHLKELTPSRVFENAKVGMYNGLDADEFKKAVKLAEPVFEQYKAKMPVPVKGKNPIMQAIEFLAQNNGFKFPH